MLQQGGLVPANNTTIAKNNFPLTVAHCRGAIGPECLKGFMMTTWARTVRDRREHILHAIDLVGQSMII